MSRLERHRRIRDLVRQRTVANQAQLLRALRRDNLKINQSTLSRDLVELGIRKIDGRYEGPRAATGGAEFEASPQVRTWSVCGPNLIVLRTQVGQAQAVGVAIDAAGDASIGGTLAGDDTVFVATAGRRQQAVALRRLTSWFGDKGRAPA